MLDIQFIRDNKDKVQRAAAAKGSDVSIDELLTVDDERRELIASVEAVRQERNEQAAELKKGRPTPEQIEHGKALKQRIADKEAALEAVEGRYKSLLKLVPNVPSEATPIGDS